MANLATAVGYQSLLFRSSRFKDIGFRLPRLIGSSLGFFVVIPPPRVDRSA
jgi:hypothetical protein